MPRTQTFDGFQKGVSSSPVLEYPELTGNIHKEPGILQCEQAIKDHIVSGNTKITREVLSVLSVNSTTVYFFVRSPAGHTTDIYRQGTAIPFANIEGIVKEAVVYNDVIFVVKWQNGSTYLDIWRVPTDFSTYTQQWKTIGDTEIESVLHSDGVTLWIGNGNLVSKVQEENITRLDDNVWKGQRSSSIPYIIGDVVYEGAVFYLCVLDNIGEALSNRVYWERIEGIDFEPERVTSVFIRDGLIVMSSDVNRLKIDPDDITSHSVDFPNSLLLTHPSSYNNGAKVGYSSIDSITYNPSNDKYYIVERPRVSLDQSGEVDYFTNSYLYEATYNENDQSFMVDFDTYALIDGALLHTVPIEISITHRRINSAYRGLRGNMYVMNVDNMNILLVPYETRNIRNTRMPGGFGIDVGIYNPSESDVINRITSEPGSRVDLPQHKQDFFRVRFFIHGQYLYVVNQNNTIVDNKILRYAINIEIQNGNPTVVLKPDDRFEAPHPFGNDLTISDFFIDGSSVFAIKPEFTPIRRLTYMIGKMKSDTIEWNSDKLYVDTNEDIDESEGEFSGNINLLIAQNRLFNFHGVSIPYLSRSSTRVTYTSTRTYPISIGEVVNPSNEDIDTSIEDVELSQDHDYYVFTRRALDLHYTREVSALASYNGNLIIGSRDITGANRAEVFTWDKSNVSWYDEDDVAGDKIDALVKFDNFLLAMVDNDVYVYRDGKLSTLKKIPFDITSVTPRKVLQVQDGVLIAVDGSGLWQVGRHSDAYDVAIHRAHRIEENITGIYYANGAVYITYTDGVNYGIKEIDRENKAIADVVIPVSHMDDNTKSNVNKVYVSAVKSVVGTTVVARMIVDNKEIPMKAENQPQGNMYIFKSETKATHYQLRIMLFANGNNSLRVDRIRVNYG